MMNSSQGIERKVGRRRTFRAGRTNRHLELVAFHEAGHAIVARTLGAKVGQVDIHRSNVDGRANFFFWDLDHGQEDPRDRAASFAGYLAERRRFHETRPRSWAVRMSQRLSMLAGARADFALLGGVDSFQVLAAARTADRILRSAWPAVCEVADYLQRNGVIPEAEAQEYFARVDSEHRLYAIRSKLPPSLFPWLRAQHKRLPITKA